MSQSSSQGWDQILEYLRWILRLPCEIFLFIMSVLTRVFQKIKDWLLYIKAWILSYVRWCCAKVLEFRDFGIRFCFQWMGKFCLTWLAECIFEDIVLIVILLGTPVLAIAPFFDFFQLAPAPVAETLNKLYTLQVVSDMVISKNCTRRNIPRV